MLEKIGSAFFYAATSLLITFSNKIVLTSYKFKYFQTLAIGQILISLIILNLCGLFKIIKFSKFDTKLCLKLIPLALLYFGNILFGLGGVKSISLPMFSCLRKVTILLTMYGEIYFLGKEKPPSIKVTVYVILLGGLIAGYYDLGFDLYGYVFVMLNNIFTVANSLYMKKALNTNLSEYEILYFNASFSIIPMLFLAFYCGEISKLKDFDKYNDLGFWLFLIISCTMGFILNYSAILCTKFNTPLTTAIVGTLKNIIIVYIGMFVGGDYKFSWLNFIGLTISSIASIYYTYLTLDAKKEPVSKKISDADKSK